ncbi:hypothetical protein OG802_08800 [Streptomyces sp. NBC_00704]|uniref:hypothetical protein n=1 Tax=Streptomyces sp. NBC_00704 TaxID=2975809 RepID=UPI002E334C02|nr:hypothetical protein [Streptomyces sp. NBC_00704]
MVRSALRALRAAAGNPRRPEPARLVPARLLPLLLRVLPQGGARRVWSEAVRALPTLALGVLERLLGFLRTLRLLGPRRNRTVAVFVATAPPVRRRPDRPAAP